VAAEVIPFGIRGMAWESGNDSSWSLFFENFEGMGRGMGNLKELFLFGIASESERQFASKNDEFFECSSLSKISVFKSKKK